MNINKEIKDFASFLNSSFEHIYAVSQRIERERNNIMLADKIENGFLQFAWETMVESILCYEENTIEPYGDGADYYATSSRIAYPDKHASYCIKIAAKNATDSLSGRSVSQSLVDFIKLVSFDGNHYGQKPPFNWVLCEDMEGEKLIYKVDEVDFVLESLPKT